MAGGSKITFGVGQYAYDLNAVETGISDAYNETEFFADYSTKLRGNPFFIYLNYVNNSDGEYAQDEDYAIIDGGTGESANVVVVALAVEF